MVRLLARLSEARVEKTKEERESMSSVEALGDIPEFNFIFHFVFSRTNNCPYTATQCCSCVLLEPEPRRSLTDKTWNPLRLILNDDDES